MEFTLSEQLQTERAALELLKAENAFLTAKLEAFGACKTQQPPHPDPAGTFNLFGLPREIRDAIYEICLVRYERQPSGPKAASQLFLINQKLRLEALAVFLSKNQFIVTGPHDMNEMYWDPVLARTNHSWRHRDPLVKRHLRSISMSLNSIESAPGAIMAQYGGIDLAKYSAYSDWEYVTTETHSRTHNYIAKVLQTRFAANLYLLFGVPRQLRKIEINLEATACASGCHRLVNDVLRIVQEKLPMLLAGAPHIAQLESVDFIGLVNEEEVQSVSRVFANSVGEKLTCHVHELPEGYQPPETDDQGN
jgi:hypothetical protein